MEAELQPAAAPRRQKGVKNTNLRKPEVTLLENR